MAAWSLRFRTATTDHQVEQAGEGRRAPVARQQRVVTSPVDDVEDGHPGLAAREGRARPAERERGQARRR